MGVTHTDRRTSDTPPRPTDNRRLLRTSSQKMHERSERHWGEVFQTEQGFRHFLMAMQMLHRQHGMEAARRCGLPTAVDIEANRLTALQEDLGEATRSGRASDTGMSRDMAWGVLYALNGSSLGATMLLRPGAALQDQPSRYLELMRDYARAGGLGVFFRALNRQTLDMTRAVAGAQTVFAAMALFDTAPLADQ